MWLNFWHHVWSLVSSSRICLLNRLTQRCTDNSWQINSGDKAIKTIEMTPWVSEVTSMAATNRLGLLVTKNMVAMMRVVISRAKWIM